MLNIPLTPAVGTRDLIAKLAEYNEMKDILTNPENPAEPEVLEINLPDLNVLLVEIKSMLSGGGYLHTYAAQIRAEETWLRQRSTEVDRELSENEVLPATASVLASTSTERAPRTQIVMVTSSASDIDFQQQACDAVSKETLHPRHYAASLADAETSTSFKMVMARIGQGTLVAGGVFLMFGGAGWIAKGVQGLRGYKAAKGLETADKARKAFQSAKTMADIQKMGAALDAMKALKALKIIRAFDIGARVTGVGLAATGTITAFWTHEQQENLDAAHARRSGYEDLQIVPYNA